MFIYFLFQIPCTYSYVCRLCVPVYVCIYEEWYSTRMACNVVWSEFGNVYLFIRTVSPFAVASVATIHYLHLTIRFGRPRNQFYETRVASNPCTNTSTVSTTHTHIDGKTKKFLVDAVVFH